MVVDSKLTYTYKTLRRNKNILEHMMDTILYDTDGKTGYKRYSNMKIYTDIEHLSEIISDGEAFLCS